MQVRFNETREADGKTYRAGQVYNLPEASAMRWIRRGIASEVPAEVRKRAAPARVKTPTVTRPKAMT